MQSIITLLEFFWKISVKIDSSSLSFVSSRFGLGLSFLVSVVKGKAPEFADLVDTC